MTSVGRGLFEECELILEVLGTSCREVSREMYPLFLFRMSNISHCTCTRSCMQAKGIMDTDVPTLWPLVKRVCVFFLNFVCMCVCWGDCSRGDGHFPMTGKGDDSTDWT